MAHQLGTLARRHLREAARTMILYISIILLVEVAALPIGANATGELHGPTRWQLVSIVWGTTIGLTLAHWFAFQVASQGIRITNLPQHVREEIVAEITGAVILAIVVTIPLLLLPEEAGEEAVEYVLAVVIGGVGYLVERSAGRARGTSVAAGALALVVGFVIATLKYKLAFH